ncbi:MAG: succinylglutamate desuccinylase/aspartoacylase family protein [Eubacterium sp.]|nr:succinylglutamate desuccinylase/aspartoacylase family protein [Eubacterium sp.]
MIDTIARVNLMVNEVLKIKKNRLMPDIITGNEKRICIVSGIYGDELQGEFVCYEVLRRIKEDYKSLTGIVDIYPFINPLSLEAKSREIPGLELDMNEMFPGTKSGTLGEYIASAVIGDILNTNDAPQAAFCLDVHGSDMYLNEILQIRLNDDVIESVMPFATKLNTDMVWIHPSTQVQDGSLVYELNKAGVPACVTESSYAYRIDQVYGNQLVDGIFNMMKDIGMWQGEVTSNIKKPTVAFDKNVTYLNSESSGIFIPNVKVHEKVEPGMKIGSVVDVLTGTIEQVVVAPRRGIISALREYPAIEVGSLLARIVGGRA